MQTNQQAIARARVLIGVSMAIFGTIGLVVRQIPLPSAEIALYRAVMAVLAIGAYLILTRRKIAVTGTGKELILLLISGVAMGVNWILLFEAYKYTTVSVATLSYYAAPVLITLASTVLFRERMTKRKLLCFVMATAGILLITLSGAGSDGQAGLSGGGTDHIGIMFGLGAAVLYASVVILNKCIRGVDPYLKTILQLGSAAVCLLPYLIVTRQFVHVEISGFSALMLFLVGLVHTGIAYTLYFGSTDGLRAQTIALFSYIDPVSALLLSMVFLHEPMTAAGVCGAVLVLGAALASEML